MTGADGFIGSHLVEMLLAEGHSVRALSCYNSFNFNGWLEEVKPAKELDIVSGDVRDPFFCEKLTEGIDTVYHLAALIAIPYSYIAPQSYIDTNVNGTINICQGALKNKCSRVMVTSTSEVYGTALYAPIDEKHPLQAQSPYSASKIGADAVAKSYYSSFGLPVTVVRPFNTYGPRQSARAVIPSIISQIAAGKKKIQIGDLRPTRDFNYVTDTCNGFIQLAGSPKAIGETINLGSGTEISISDLFNMIAKIMKSKAEPVMDKQRIRPERSEVHRLVCDSSFAKKLTGYKAKVSLEEGLMKTMEWFTTDNNLAKYKHNTYNV